MSEDRLSALQKWILTHALDNNNMLNKSTVYTDYWNIDLDDDSRRRYGYRDSKIMRRRQTYAVILSNSLRRLRAKGLITYTNLKYTARLGKIYLTAEGRKRAVEIKINS